MLEECVAVPSIALLPHSGKRAALDMADSLISHLEGRGIEVWLEREAAETLGRAELTADDEAFAASDAAIVLGGDGAFLRAARTVAPLGVPLLGVNLGHLGFLTAVEPNGLYAALDRVLSGDYSIEERLMLKATITRSGERVASFFGLNDAVVTRGVFPRVIELETYVDDVLIGTFLADGIIVSTPTGSTAYSLSAGGPIVNPGIEALVITPICPHTVGARALITRPDERVTIRMAHERTDAMLTVDGQVGDVLRPGDEVEVTRAGKPARLVNLIGRSFYDLLHSRLLQGSPRAEGR